MYDSLSHVWWFSQFHLLFVNNLLILKWEVRVWSLPHVSVHVALLGKVSLNLSSSSFGIRGNLLHPCSNFILTSQNRIQYWKYRDWALLNTHRSLGMPWILTLTTPPRGLISSSRLLRAAMLSSCDEVLWNEMCFNFFGSFLVSFLVSLARSFSFPEVAACSKAWTWESILFDSFSWFSWVDLSWDLRSSSFPPSGSPRS